MRKNINVIVKMDEFGNITPLTILWSNTLTLQIDKIIDIRKKARLKGGGMGVRYTCRIKGHERFLWLDEYTWFVEI